MWLKWIRCSVEKNNREAFCDSQQQWSAIRGEAGLVGQFGGWDTLEPNNAGIVGLWQNQKSLEAFMTPGGTHDRIYAATGQEGLLQSVQTNVYHELFPMPGALPSLRAAARESTFMRVAQFRVSSEKYPLLLRAQRQIWIPALRKVEGMLGGSFGTDGTDGFLVVTMWRDADLHEAYHNDVRPDLRREVMEMGGFPDTLDGCCLNVEPRWNIL